MGIGIRFQYFYYDGYLIEKYNFKNEFRERDKCLRLERQHTLARHALLSQSTSFFSTLPNPNWLFL